MEPPASRSMMRARQGHDLMLDIDVQGAAQVRRAMPEAVSIFVLPPNPKVLRTRLRNRSRAEGQVNEAELYRRLSEASKEIENYRDYSYILINDILDRAVAQLEAIVLAERYYRNSEPIAVRAVVCWRWLRPAVSRIRRNGLNPCWRPLASMHPSGQQQLNFDEDPDDD